jgi:hypothetical protein
MRLEHGRENAELKKNRHRWRFLRICWDSLCFRLRAPAFTQPPLGREPKVKKAGKENEAMHRNIP